MIKRGKRLLVRLELHNCLNFLQSDKNIEFIDFEHQEQIVNKIMDILDERKVSKKDELERFKETFKEV